MRSSEDPMAPPNLFKPIMAGTLVSCLLFDLGAFYWGVESDPIFQGLPGWEVGIPLLLLLVFALVDLVFPAFWWRSHRLRSFLPILAIVLAVMLCIPALRAGVAFRSWIK